MPDLLEKQPSESRLYDMDFSPKMVQGVAPEAIASVVSVAQLELQDDGTRVATTDLTFPSAATFAAQIAQQRIEVGLDGKTYVVTYIVTTDLGNTLEAEGLLLVIDR
jgi:hypothetical protein